MTHRELIEKYPDKTFGEVNVRREYHYFFPEYPKKDDDLVVDEGWQIYLEHSCDYWEIGSRDDAVNMISDLNKAIDYCDARP
jgi:hypothetical protein